MKERERRKDYMIKESKDEGLYRKRLRRRKKHSTAGQKEKRRELKLSEGVKESQ